MNRRETDAIANPVDITKVKWKSKPLTAEVLKIIKEKQREKKLGKKEIKGESSVERCPQTSG